MITMSAASQFAPLRVRGIRCRFRWEPVNHQLLIDHLKDIFQGHLKDIGKTLGRRGLQ